ncbi:serine/threonine-protein kinase pim-2-like isoform X4 [Siniperca chuatsi]|uniref:serine/threonine-protein kinase pim-2-like isoform X4 n=1 Tax=Siniperca chuatsi TaxID=119488 RepID=UPI001CE214ED|nr:serine/threonine-protein kinase pim-2-like isoform X4 [Siniperca chuatsi]
MNHYCLRVMDSKSWPTLSTVQCRASSRHLGRPTDPMIYAVEECRSEGSKKTFKKNSEESLERASKRSRTSHSPSEGCSQIFSWPSSSDDAASSSSAYTSPIDSTAAFEAKYEEEELLGEGGFGSVFAGHRKDDNLPVAIKHIPQFDITRTSVFLDGKISMIPLEVALLLKVKPAAAGSSAAITLLDWYDLDYELILILERPVPCLDLIEYMNYRGSTLQEHEAKTIAKQLVDALIEVHSRGVFHGDIKLDNILIETDSDVPRIRLIDFGCGTFLSEGIYTTKQATYMYTTPEWFLDGWYRAEPTTVWQLGVVLFAILHGYLPFSNSTEIVYGNPDISNRLSFVNVNYGCTLLTKLASSTLSSKYGHFWLQQTKMATAKMPNTRLQKDCQGFLLSCLIKGPEARPTLETLKQLPWLI